MRVCKKCGKPVEGARCKPCRLQWKREWTALYKVKNKEKVKAYHSSYRLEHKERDKPYFAAYRTSHKEQAHNNYIANLEARKAATRQWRIDHPEARRIQSQTRRAKKKTPGIRLSKGLIGKLVLLQKGKCPCCKKTFGRDFQVDHKLPLALGGQNVDHNIQLLCKSCNGHKHAKHPVEFMQSLGFLL